jgi:excisionase family DNA binding protein
MQQEIECPEWLTYEQATRLVGLGRTTLWRLTNSGEIKSARVGRALRINRTSLLAYMERCADQVQHPYLPKAH